MAPLHARAGADFRPLRYLGNWSDEFSAKKDSIGAERQKESRFVSDLSAGAKQAAYFPISAVPTFLPFSIKVTDLQAPLGTATIKGEANLAEPGLPVVAL